MREYLGVQLDPLEEDAQNEIYCALRDTKMVTWTIDELFTAKIPAAHQS